MLRLSTDVISLVNRWDRFSSEKYSSSTHSRTWDEIEIKAQCDAIEAHLIGDHSPDDTDLDGRQIVLASFTETHAHGGNFG